MFKRLTESWTGLRIHDLLDSARPTVYDIQFTRSCRLVGWHHLCCSWCVLCVVFLSFLVVDHHMAKRESAKVVRELLINEFYAVWKTLKKTSNVRKKHEIHSVPAPTDNICRLYPFHCRSLFWSFVVPLAFPFSYISEFIFHKHRGTIRQIVLSAERSFRTYGDIAPMLFYRIIEKKIYVYKSRKHGRATQNRLLAPRHAGV